MELQSRLLPGLRRGAGEADRQLFFLVAIAATLIGAVWRFIPVWSHAFPVNDGGLFYTMAEDLRRNNFALPWTTSYNQAGIPWAYPPLGLYLAAALAAAGMPLLSVLRLVPSLVSVLTVPAFARLARLLLPTPRQAAWATMGFALLPLGFMQSIKGGGITRAPGLLFALLALGSVYQMYTTARRRAVVEAALFAGLTLLSHPEAALFLAYSAGLMFLVWGRQRQGIGRSLVVLVGAMLVSAFWWLPLLLRHSPALLSVVQTGHRSFGSLLSFILFFDSAQRSLEGLAVLAIIGVLTALNHRQFFVPAWWGVILLLDLRGGFWRLTIPLALLAGMGIEWGMLPLLPPKGWAHRLGKIALVGLLLHLLTLSWVVLTPGDPALATLTEEDLVALSWVSASLPMESRVLVITGGGWEWWDDPLAEWFPALTGRRNPIVVQGSEWLAPGEFNRRIKQYERLQRCATLDAHCLRQWAEQEGMAFTHVYVRTPLPGTALADELGPAPSPLATSLQSDGGYKPLYAGPGGQVFALVGDP